MRADYRPVLRSRVDGDLELARQEGELRVKGRPLAQDFAIRARVGQFVRCNASKLVGGDVADAVARRLDGVHFDACQLAENRRRFFELRPVELHVLARGEVADAAVVASRNLGQFAQLFGCQHAVRNGDAQHRAVALDVQAVLQAQGTQFVVGKLAG